MSQDILFQSDQVGEEEKITEKALELLRLLNNPDNVLQLAKEGLPGEPDLLKQLYYSLERIMIFDI